MQLNKFKLKELFKAIIKSIIYLFFSFVILRLKMLMYLNMQNYKYFFIYGFHDFANFFKETNICRCSYPFFQGKNVVNSEKSFF